MTRRTPRRVRSLASRMVALGALQFALLVATAVTIFFAEGSRRAPKPREHLAPEVVHRLELLAEAPGALTLALAALADERIEVSMYDARRALVASNIDPPLAIPNWPRLRRPPHDRRGPLAGAAPHRHPHPPGPGELDPPPPPLLRPPPPPDDFDPPPPDRGWLDDPRGPGGPRAIAIPLRLRGERGLLIARGVHRGPGIVGPLLTLACGLAIVILGALLTARWIVRPVERLTRTARALGGGDLRARSRLARADEIGELGRRMDEMADRIAGLLVSEKELLANVAHELRTPLARIGVALDLAGEGDAAAARASLAEIAVDVAELETIVDDILVAMRFEIAGGAQLPLRRERVAPAEIAAAAAERLRARHPERPLDVAVAPALPAIDVDRRLFRRVVDNLLENAHKYSPDPAARIDLAVARDGARVVFEVRDRGAGIAPEDLPRVFSPFFRGERSRSREAGGVGLGLTLAKRIVDAHDGSIDVASAPGEGTRVRVAVPA